MVQLASAAFLTGGRSRIARGVAGALVAAGARVAIADADESRARGGCRRAEAFGRHRDDRTTRRRRRAGLDGCGRSGRGTRSAASRSCATWTTRPGAGRPATKAVPGVPVDVRVGTAGASRGTFLPRFRARGAPHILSTAPVSAWWRWGCSSPVRSRPASATRWAWRRRAVRSPRGAGRPQGDHAGPAAAAGPTEVSRQIVELPGGTSSRPSEGWTTIDTVGRGTAADPGLTGHAGAARTAGRTARHPAALGGGPVGSVAHHRNQPCNGGAATPASPGERIMVWPAGKLPSSPGPRPGIGLGDRRALVGAGAKGGARRRRRRPGSPRSPRSCARQGGTVTAVPLDVSDEEAGLDGCGRHRGSRTRSISILCNVAGVNGGGTIEDTLQGLALGPGREHRQHVLGVHVRPADEGRSTRAHIPSTRRRSRPGRDAARRRNTPHRSSHPSGFTRSCARTQRRTSTSLLVPGTVATRINFHRQRGPGQLLDREPNREVIEGQPRRPRQGADPDAVVGQQVVEALRSARPSSSPTANGRAPAPRMPRSGRRSTEFDGPPRSDTTADAPRRHHTGLSLTTTPLTEGLIACPR
ncbi:hypothetical protein HBB16_01955 [Pseudonocardia sp. MCCB 268]|nr:hypothetical protein [Pseudonocardia cytotoxica]